MAGNSLLDTKRILIVDDEPDVLDTLADLLPMCVLTKASTFDQAKELLKTRDFDIAILDIMGVRGYDLLDIANERNVLSVMLTAHAFSPDDTVKSYKRGAAFFVPKEKMSSITEFLSDVLGAREKGENYWVSWLDRLGPYYDKRFGPDWKDSDKEFWESLARQNWRLASVLRRKEQEEEF